MGRAQGRAEAGRDLVRPGRGVVEAVEGGHLRRREPVGRGGRVREDPRGAQGCVPDLPERRRPDLPRLEGEARLHGRVFRSGRQLQLAEEGAELTTRRPNKSRTHFISSFLQAGCRTISPIAPTRVLIYWPPREPEARNPIPETSDFVAGRRVRFRR